MFKKEITLLMSSNKMKGNVISRIDVIFGGDHGQDFLDFQ